MNRQKDMLTIFEALHANMLPKASDLIPPSEEISAKTDLSDIMKTLCQKKCGKCQRTKQCKFEFEGHHLYGKKIASVEDMGGEKWSEWVDQTEFEEKTDYDRIKNRTDW